MPSIQDPVTFPLIFSATLGIPGCWKQIASHGYSAVMFEGYCQSDSGRKPSPWQYLPSGQQGRAHRAFFQIICWSSFPVSLSHQTRNCNTQVGFFNARLLSLSASISTVGQPSCHTTHGTSRGISTDPTFAAFLKSYSAWSRRLPSRKNTDNSISRTLGEPESALPCASDSSLQV